MRTRGHGGTTEPEIDRDGRFEEWECSRYRREGGIKDERKRGRKIHRGLDATLIVERERGRERGGGRRWGRDEGSGEQSDRGQD